jgi:hypothetical protein
MEAQYEKMKCDHDACMKRFKEAEIQVEEAGNEAEMVYDTEIEMSRNFRIGSGPATPGGEMPGFLPTGETADNNHYLHQGL